MNHIIRHPHLVVLDLWLTGAFRGVLGFQVFSSKTGNTSYLSQGHESTFFQDINWKPYSTMGGTVVRWYHGKIMGS